MKIRPLGDKILVKRVDAQTKTASGIYLPESAAEKPQEAKVVRVGDGRTTDAGGKAPFTVKEGDRILLSKWGGTEVKIDGQEYLILSEDEVLGIIE